MAVVEDSILVPGEEWDVTLDRDLRGSRIHAGSSQLIPTTVSTTR